MIKIGVFRYCKYETWFHFVKWVANYKKKIKKEWDIMLTGCSFALKVPISYTLN